MHEVDVLVKKTKDRQKIDQKEHNDVAIVVHRDEEAMKKREKYSKHEACA